MNELTVSACIITYNQRDYIRQCLEGAVSQKVNFKYEIIIGDDCSTDGTSAICEEFALLYPNLIKILPKTKNLGMTGNWMHTIQNCNGKYIALCEGDDYWTDITKLQQQVDFLEANPEYVLSFHQIKIQKADGTILEDFITTVPESHENIEDLAKLGNYIHTPSVVFRNVKPVFPAEFQLSPIADYFLYMILAQHGKVKYIKKEMAVYRHGVGIFSGEAAIKMAKTSVIMFSCLFSYLTDPKIKQLIFQRHNETLDHVERLARKEYENAFVSKNLFFRLLNILQKNYKYPKKAIRKAYLEVFNKK